MKLVLFESVLAALTAKTITYLIVDSRGFSSYTVSLHSWRKYNIQSQDSENGSLLDMRYEQGCSTSR